MQRKNRALAFALSALFMLGLAAAWAESSPDAKFLTDAIRSDVGDIKLAELAQQRGQSQSVRELGETLAEQDTAALQKAAELASALDVIPPTQPSAASTKKHETLSKLSGAEFDRAFIAEIIASHEQEIAKFSAHAASSDSAVAALAADTLPTLKERLARAQTLRSELFASTSDG